MDTSVDVSEGDDLEVNAEKTSHNNAGKNQMYMEM